jgi:AraC-like DNA-binding protein
MDMLLDERVMGPDAWDRPALGCASVPALERASDSLNIGQGWAAALLGIEFRSRDLRGLPHAEAASSREPGLTSYIGRGFGFFVSDPAAAPAIDSKIEVKRAILIVTVAIGTARERFHRLDSRISTRDSYIRIAYLPPNTAFDGLICEDGLRSVTLMLDPAAMAQNLELPLPCLPYAIHALIGSSTVAMASYPISSGVQRVAEEALDHVPQAGSLGGLFYRMKALQFFWEIVDRFSTEDRIATHTHGPSEKELSSVDRVKILLEANPEEEYPIERLARLAAMNRTKLRSIFKKTYGQTISQFRTEIRMKRAHELLYETEASVAEIGFDLGYADASSFIVAFKKYFGFNPGWIRSGQRTSAGTRRGRENQLGTIAEHA